MRKRNIALLENYPECPQDLNPIETTWREVRSRLDNTQLVATETRADLVLRMRLAVSWVNRNRMDYFARLCSS